jgi:IS30 family transposase
MPRNRPSIRHRPKHIQLRQQPGHWEADTMLGNHSHPARVLATVERTSRYTQLGLLPQGGKASHTARALHRILTPHEVRSITFDNGSEFALYERACNALGASPYFAEPARPGQRGTCENTIGLIRQYLPKYQSLARLTADKLSWIQDRLNHRPRKCLGYLTPHEVLFDLKPTPVALRT